MTSDASDDTALVTLAQQGDMAALDALVRRHQAWVFNLALRMVWRRPVAEDATQETFFQPRRAVNPACSKWWSPVRASVMSSSAMMTKEMQSVRDQALSGRSS